MSICDKCMKQSVCRLYAEREGSFDCMEYRSTNFDKRAEVIISQLRADRDRLQNALDSIRDEIAEFEEEVFHRPNTDYSDYAAVRHCLEIVDKCGGDDHEDDDGDN